MMTEAAISPNSDPRADDPLRAELAAGDAVLGAAASVLRHLLAIGDNLLLSEEIVARIRGMLTDVSRQLLRAEAEAAGKGDDSAYVTGRLDALQSGLLGNSGLLRHMHALAVETQLSEYLRVRSGIDPVLTPLLQALIASSDARVSAEGMAVLAAQARFVQNQRRMELPLGELPGDLFKAALDELSNQASVHDSEAADAANSALQDKFEPSASRLSLLAQLVSSLEGGPRAALSIEQAGIGLFASALALGSNQSRDATILATNPVQSSRIALMLRVAGLSPQAVATQLLSLHPEMALPAWLADLTEERAWALLSSTASGGTD